MAKRKNSQKKISKKPFSREDFVKWGKVSGNINRKKGKKYFSKIGKMGAKKRWSNYKLIKKENENS